MENTEETEEECVTMIQIVKFRLNRKNRYTNTNSTEIAEKLFKH